MMATSPVRTLTAILTTTIGLGGMFSHSANAGPPVPPAFSAPPRTAAVGPPPGTLTITYRQPSRPVPRDKHPRTGMLDVWNVPAGIKVTVENLNGYRGKDGVWHFETGRPLVPGIPHIYRVHIGPQPVRTYATRFATGDMRTVRLIRGRIVDLRY